MKISKLCSRSLWKDSFLYAISFIAAIETICAVADFSITDVVNVHKWWLKGIIIIGTFTLLWLIIAAIKASKADHSITLKIKGRTVKIEEGDIFNSPNWKLIPFNEFFDTTVDDIVIAHNSLNGKFIERLPDIDALNRRINEAEDVPRMRNKTKAGRTCYPLGRIITYHDYMLLAFSHFENNQATLSHNDYETCLRAMWKEISRVYANKPITMPLLGGGVTRITDKNEFQLLRCILCTLNTSDAQIYQPITIILTRETIDKINLYDIKNIFKS